jgi:peptide/nickel transport system permease protein
MEPIELGPEGALVADVASTPTRRRGALLGAARTGIGAGGLLLLVIVGACLAAPLAGSPTDSDVLDRLAPPSAEHWFGTDGDGRDVFARTLYAGRYDILIAIGSAGISFVAGTLIGLLLGYFRGWLSEAAMRVLDVIQSFPLLVLALVLLAFLGTGTMTFIYAIAFIAVPIFIRLVRSETLAVRSRTFVEAAQMVGNSQLRIMLRHVLPNVITSALIQLTSLMASAILIVGALSFLGVGVQPPRAEWGLMIQQGSQYAVTGQWWPTMFPGLAIVLTVLALHTIGEGFVKLRRVG